MLQETQKAAWRAVKKYMLLSSTASMDKYLTVVMIFLIAGMAIALTREPPQISLFYTMIAGTIGVMLYSAYKARIERREANRKKRKSKK